MPNATDHSPNPEYPPPYTSSNNGGNCESPRGAAAFAKSVWERLPALLLAFAVAFAAFAYGAAMVENKAFPYQSIQDARKTLRAAFETETVAADHGRFRGAFHDARPEAAAASRIEFAGSESLGGPVLWQGGRWEFMDICPEWGCIAVEYSADGEVVHAYPYRPDELQRAMEASFAAAEHLPEFAPGFSLQRDILVSSVSQYENGDLLAIFIYGEGKAFPFSCCAARIDRDGRPVWFRLDYSHHWAHLEASGVALIPGLSVGGGDLTIKRGTQQYTLDCDTDKPYEDTINFVDEDGRLLKRINLVDAVLESRYALALTSTAKRGNKDDCDPLHLNYVHRLGPDAGGAWGIAPGDIVASLRNLSAFAVIDPETGALKRLVRGAFFDQHSVHHIEGSTFIMFDNHGSDGVHGPSRLLAIDIADGSETTIFPNDRTPEDLRNLYSGYAGDIDISPDRSRAIVSFTKAGTGVEVRLPDGEVLSVFRNLHDVSGLEQFPEGRGDKAARFTLLGINYID